MSRKKRIILGVVVAIIPIALLLSSIETYRIEEPQSQSAYRLKSIGLAILNYQEANGGRLPPAVIRTKEGKPLFSWRVAILPHLEENHIYQEFHLDEPWDSPHNLKLAQTTPRSYTAWSDNFSASGLTRYQVLVGPGTASEKDGLTVADFPDGPSNTILVVEASQPVLWTKPDDLIYDPTLPLPPLGSGLHKPVKLVGYRLWWKPGFLACFADASVRFIRQPIDDQVLRPFITRNGGEKVDPADLE